MGRPGFGHRPPAGDRRRAFRRASFGVAVFRLRYRAGLRSQQGFRFAVRRDASGPFQQGRHRRLASRTIYLYREFRGLLADRRRDLHRPRRQQDAVADRHGDVQPHAGRLRRLRSLSHGVRIRHFVDALQVHAHGHSGCQSRRRLDDSYRRGLLDCRLFRHHVPRRGRRFRQYVPQRRGFALFHASRGE